MLPESFETNVLPFRPAAYTVKLADRDWEVAQARALRRQVFCLEQGLFRGSDLDTLDGHAIPIVALGWWYGAADQVVGTVRIHHHGDGLWWGSRLAVAIGYRRLARLGSELIRFAVGTAHGRSCTRFLAHVQQTNVPLFESLHWRTLETVTVQARPHALMEADLAHYPPCADDKRGIIALHHRAA